MTPVVIRRSSHWVATSRVDRIAERILSLLAEEPQVWRGGPGRPWSWWMLRGRLGGRVRGGDFRAALDALIERGIVMELWDAHPDRPEQARHLVVPVAGFDGYDIDQVIEVVGREDVIGNFDFD